MDIGSSMALIGGVSAVGSILGSVLGQRANIGWIKEKLAEHDKEHKSHAKRLAAHDLSLGLLENRQ